MQSAAFVGEIVFGECAVPHMTQIRLFPLHTVLEHFGGHGPFDRSRVRVGGWWRREGKGERRDGMGRRKG